MRAAVLGWLALCAATAVRCASPQIVYQLQSDREPDLVDQLVGEARERNIPLDSELRPTDVERHSASFAWGVCGGSELAVQVQSIALNPDPPVKGQNLTVHGKGTLHTEVKNGTFIDLSVRVGFLRIFSQRVDVCEALKENDVEIQCPLAPGVYDVKHTAELPAHIPPAKYSVHVTGETHDGKPLACLDVALSFSMFSQARRWLGW
ncbi:uncharacterized protein MJAP1_001265 [Malassezia japonica]|uniref:Phosphatidylglycerol/phosphatidylinositol transfer protein n=1 Tax=Malassezia japonica TaxID=223818 RepID=A0AAF0F1H3_9BASI|nr:uncharacterized protein MJAP1_001265 [Malassezia japonica]WFD38314.1 hypothetical protein MJAP1_001265 [Malassezia japonica]